ncbi:MAG: L,D-transpeptidase [Sandaracinus sp.]
MLALALAASLLASFTVVACGGDDETPDAYEAPAEPVDAAIDAPPPPPPGPPRRLFAKRYVVKVHSQALRESERLGYLRAGSTHMATTHDPVGFEGCREGWYELETGGFVCNGRDVIAFDGRRLPARPPAQPDFEAELPYRYARARRDNLAIYRRLPTDEEAAIYEGYRIPGLEPPPEAEGAAPAEGAEAAPPPTLPEPEMMTASGPAESAGAEGALDPTEPVVPTLASLEGERGGVLLRRTLRGFIVSVDRDVRTGARRYWRTLSNEIIPYSGLDRPRAQQFITSSGFRGAILSREPLPDAGVVTEDAGPRPTAASGELHLPIGFVMSSKVNQFTLGRDGRPRRGRAPGYHHMFEIRDEVDLRGTPYVTSTDGRLFRTEDVRVLRAATERPEGVGENDQWIDIDLSTQTLIAYEGLTPVFATLVSTGRVRDPEDPLRDMRTPAGLFRITSKHVTHTMDGDHAADGPYSIEDVPYVMYFQLAFALHSAFWHDGFGRPRSHGCVNLSPHDARWLFQWAGPRLPEHWHAIFPRPQNPATWVNIRGETPEG